MKKFISLLAVICLLCLFSTFSFADDYQSSTVPVYATVDGGIFKASVPEKITINSANNGKISKYTIYNDGTVPILISSISVTPDKNWSPITTGNFSAYNQYKIDIEGVNSSISAGSSGTYNYTASIPSNQPFAINNAHIADVVFTIAVDNSFSNTPIVPTAYNVSNNEYNLNSIRYFKIAEYGSYSLLILADTYTASTHPALPSNAVAANISDDYSLPSTSEEPMFFKLSQCEYNSFCLSISAPNQPFALRQGVDGSNSYVDTNNTTQGGIMGSEYVRSAVWVKTTSLPSTTT